MSTQPPHHILFYDYVPDIMHRRGPHREGHLARIKAQKAAGRVVMAGALGQPPHGGAIVFRDVQVATIEAFVREDPYMQAQLIEAWRIEPWTLV